MAPGVATPTRVRVGRASDEALLAAAREGSDEAFLALYDRYRDLAWRVARSVAPNDLDAEDAVAEAFSRIYAAVADREIASFRSYLAASVRNTATDAYRRRERPVDDDELRHGLESAGRSGASVEERIVDLDDRSLVGEAFETLPERHRVAIWLSQVEEFSTAEVGDVLGTSANGAAALTMRARERLRTAYLQVHLRAASDAACAGATSDLAAHLRGGLSRRATRKLEAHLEGCSACGNRLTELRTLNETLAAAIPAAPVGLLTGERVLDGIHSGGRIFPTPGGEAGAGGRWGDPATSLSEFTTRAMPYTPASQTAAEHVLSPVAAAVAGLLVAGIAASGAPGIDRDPGTADRPGDVSPALLTPGGDTRGTDGRSGDDSGRSEVELEADPAAHRAAAPGSSEAPAGGGDASDDPEAPDAPDADDLLGEVADNAPALPEDEGGGDGDQGADSLLNDTGEEVNETLGGGGNEGSEPLPSEPTGVGTVDAVADDAAHEVERVDDELGSQENGGEEDGGDENGGDEGKDEPEDEPEDKPEEDSSSAADVAPNAS